MILDTLNNIQKYNALNPLFCKVVDFIHTHDLKNMPDGVVEIQGKELFVNICSPKGKESGEAVLETHDRMIDIQVPLKVTETFGYTPRTALPETEYNENNDISFYVDKPQQFIEVNPGEFVVFFPQDGHAPCIAKADKMKKAIFKIAFCVI